MQLLLIVQYFSVSEGGLQIQLLDLDELVNEKSESISDYLSHVTQSLNITSKCVAFGADNTNCNFGGLKKKEGDNVFTHLNDIAVSTFYDVSLEYLSSSESLKCYN